MDGQPRNRLAAAWLSDGSVTPWNPNITGAQVSRIVLDQDLLYAGGAFSEVAGAPRDNVAAVDTATALPTPWNPGAGVAVESLAVAAGNVFVGSVHDRGGVVRHNLAAIDARTGQPVADWNPDPDGRVTALSLAGGNLYFGGDFTTVGGQSRERLAAVRTATGELTDWNPGANATPLAIVAGTVFVTVGGRFTFIGGSGSAYVATLDATTGAPARWSPTPNGEVHSLHLEIGSLYLAGQFTQVNGYSRPGFAAVDLHNEQVLSWDPQIQGGAAVGEAVRVFASPAYLAGSFTTVRGEPRLNVAAVDKATGVVLPWNPVVEPAGRGVTTLAQSKAFFYVGGNFDHVGGQPRNGLAAIEDLSGATTPWNPQLKSPVPGTVVSALNASVERVEVGGAFTTIGGRFSPNFAIFPPEGVPRIGREPRDQILPVGDTIQLQAEVSGQQPLVFQWQFNGTNLPHAVTDRLEIPNAQVEHSGEYTLIIANGLGLTRTRVATVVVYTPIAITADPISQVVSPNATVHLAVSATGDPAPTYQWRLNGVNIPGAVYPTYTITNAQPADGGSYDVVVVNIGGAVASAVATVIITSPTLDLEDDFTNRVTFVDATGLGAAPTAWPPRKSANPIMSASSAANPCGSVGSRPPTASPRSAPGAARSIRCWPFTPAPIWTR